MEILSIIFLTIFIATIVTLNKNNNKINIDDKYNFKSKEKLLTQTEYKFYKLINNIAQKQDLIVFSQVALNQIIKPNTYKELKIIGGKSIDFVLIDKYTNIKLCIELDDYTHNQEKRKTRDNIVNDIFNQCKMKLLRIPIEKAFTVERIEKIIKESL